ncbi:MAG: methyltransferase domain-containing protein [Acidobacteriota bacterium]|nr:methyltransferase domain-containing protein [Acidobacteriota bacterium]
MLHLAPEPQLILKFNALKHIRYVSADLDSPIAMMKMDITDIPFADGEFGVIFCSHVLEHVDDDRTAMRELLRVLDDKGWALLDVPITAEKTFEDPSVTDPDERTRLFGQPDHVRRYGPDFADRLQEAGFEVKVIYAHTIIDEAMQIKMRVPADEKVFYCTKPTPKAADREKT